MTAPFFDRLKTYYIAIGRALAANQDLTGILPNPSDKGLSRELAYAEILRQLLPASCQVALGGYVFGQNGDESRQMDVLVFSDLALQYGIIAKTSIPKTFTCVDGIVGVVSIKTHLSGKEMIDALGCISSLPQKLPLDGRVPDIVKLGGYEEWPYKVVCAYTGLAARTILRHIEAFYESNPSIPYDRRPNVVHVLGKYCIIRTSSQGEETRLGRKLPRNAFVIADNDPDFVGFVKSITNMHKIAMAMRWVITDYADLFDKIPLPQDPV